MSKRTIEAYEKVKAERVKQDEPSSYLGCTCSNPQCKTTWIVCKLPQPISRIATFTGWHTRCPCCATLNPQVATASEIRRLMPMVEVQG